MEQVSTIFLAGHETSASTMTWALYMLAECAHIQDRVRAGGHFWALTKD